MTTLTTGSYQLPPGCFVNVFDNRVEVVKRAESDGEPRCRNCKHYGQGYYKANQWRASFVCTARTKPSGYNYATYPTKKACYLFIEME